jgi:sulfate/thiosulfate transport system ATP-binding protein
MTLRVRNLSRRYGAEAALASIDLDIVDGEFLALLGPSGAGKTTLLRLIAGLDRPDGGSIFIGDCDVHQLAPRDRRIGFVFQNYALFRHMSVARNIAFGLTVKPRRERPSRQRIAARVEELLDLMQLSGLGNRFPAQLSGGQRQRVALARALAVEPEVLLLDEPFGALDAKVRGELREWLRGLQRQLSLTTIFVTHDQHEAFQLADRVAILHAGRIEQIGTPTEIRGHPATPFVRTFLGAAEHPAPQLPSIGIDESVFVQEEHGHPACLTPPKQTALGISRPIRAAINGDRPSWTPRVANLLADEPASDDLPTVAVGELWLMGLAGTDGGPTLLERDALNHANVIVYDRALTAVVAAVMPLGGYAEPTDDDGLARSLQFVRDGWSVVRLLEQAAPGNLDRRFEALAAGLREAAALPGWRLWRVSEHDGRWVSVDDEALSDGVDLLSVAGLGNPREAIVVGAALGGAGELSRGCVQRGRIIHQWRPDGAKLVGSI